VSYLGAFLAIEQPPVTHPAIDVCGGPAVLCQINYTSVVATLVSIAVTVAFSFWVASRVDARRPGKFQMVFEFIMDYARNQLKTVMGSEPPAIALPLALTLFFYILIANWIGFFPIPEPFTPANTDFNQTLAMGLVVFLVAEGYSLKRRGVVGFLHHLTRPFELPIPARAAFVLLNIIEEIAKPITLSLRLMGNIFGGLVMLWVLTVMLTLVPVPYVPYALSVVLVVVWKLFDVLFIGTLQAFIFFLLTIIYFGQAVEGLDEEHGHAPAPGPAEKALPAASTATAH
jgi:F-type H+-transporting ATPase subunit a